MLDRIEIYKVIDKEREFQDKTYSPDEKLSGGIGPTRRQRDEDVTSHLVLLDIYVDKAKEAWNVKGDNRPALQQIAKIAAIAVRALERAKGSDAVLEGLR